MTQAFDRTRATLYLLAIATLLVFAPSAQAALDNSGNYFWDNQSWDGSGLTNIGFCLTGTGTCGDLGGGAPGVIPFWGLPGGGADPNFLITSNSQFTFTFEMQMAGNNPYDSFGWINPGDPNSGGLLLLDSVSQGTSVTLAAGTYGLYFTDTAPDINETWYSQSFLNPAGETGDQHFVVFNNGGAFWIGMEDQPFNIGTDKDFQDMVVQVTTGAGGHLGIEGTGGAGFETWSLVPEPGTLSLLGIGIFGLALKRRKLAR